jgi:hypothetical protein
MRYLWSSLLLLFLLAGTLAPAAEAAPAKRPPGKQSSMASIRKKQKFVRKPLVYDHRKNRPLVAKKTHWWQKR